MVHPVVAENNLRFKQIQPAKTRDDDVRAANIAHIEALQPPAGLLDLAREQILNAEPGIWDQRIGAEGSVVQSVVYNKDERRGIDRLEINSVTSERYGEDGQVDERYGGTGYWDEATLRPPVQAEEEQAEVPEPELAEQD